jgi:LysM repeat protein
MYHRLHTLANYGLFLGLLWLGLAAPVAAQSSPTHTVGLGETLSEIAESYGIALDELMALNGIDDPNAIYAGQVLVLPSEHAAPAPEIVVDPVQPTPDAETTHVVQPGDTLTGIAAAYGLDPAELMALNGIADPNTIVVGQKLRLTPILATDPAQPAPTPARPATGTLSATLNQLYTVAAGDHLDVIALRFGVDRSALIALNRLDVEVPLSLGQQLILPATAAELIAAPREPAPTPRRGVVGASLDVYTVRPGDSLSTIAQAHGYSLADLMTANQIDNPDMVYVGQALMLPAPAVTATAAVTATVTATVAAPVHVGAPRRGYFYYTVKPGDTLSELAREFDTTVLALLEYNDLPNAETVFEGLNLRIPYGPAPLPLTLPPAPISGTRFVVSLSRQQCWVLQGEQVRYGWTCSTGYGAWITRTGMFAVQTKVELAKSTAYELDMPYWLGIYDVGPYENGIHGLPVKWETGEKIWEGLIGQPATFGCAMLADDDAKTLFELAFLGMPVYIVQ